MMRILRLYAPSLIGDHTLCYVSTNREGNVCINDVEIPVLWARAGEPLDGEERAAAMTVGEYLLPTSFCTTSTGRTPPCSLPTTGLRSA